MSSEAKAKWVFRRSDGRELVFGDETFPILEMTGIGRIKPEVFTKKRARGDGNIVTGKRLPAREFGVMAELNDYRLNPTMLRRLESFFSHLHTYDVEITYLNEPRYLAKCELLDFNCPPENVYLPLKPSVSMLAPDGYFLSVDPFGKDLAANRGGLAFPYVNLVGGTFPVGLYEFASKINLYNDGDDVAFCTVKMVFTDDVVNPTVSIGDVYVKVIDSFVKDDVLIIDSYSNSVTKNGAKADTKLERGSRLRDFTLAVGDNSVSYTAEIGSNAISVYVYFNKRYLGV